MYTTSPLIEVIAGYVLIVAALPAFCAGSAMVLESTYKRIILPMGERGPEPNTTGAVPKRPIGYELGEPGVKVAQ